MKHLKTLCKFIYIHKTFTIHIWFWIDYGNIVWCIISNPFCRYCRTMKTDILYMQQYQHHISRQLSSRWQMYICRNFFYVWHIPRFWNECFVINLALRDEIFWTILIMISSSKWTIYESRKINYLYVIFISIIFFWDIPHHVLIILFFVI